MEPDWLKKARDEGRVLNETPIKPLSGKMTEGQVRELLLDLSEAEFQLQVIEYAQSLGWAAAHFRRVRVQRANGEVYWETPVAADGKGWPDLLLVRERIIYAELKSETGTLRPEQKVWNVRLEAAGAEYYLWRPRDWKRIVAALKST